MRAFLLLACLLSFGVGFSQAIPARYAGTYNEVVRVKGDTAEITDNIRFIKVDGKVFEIKRSTSIDEAKPPQIAFPQGWQLFNSAIPIPGGIIYDTLNAHAFGSGITFTTPLSMTVPAIGVYPAMWK